MEKLKAKWTEWGVDDKTISTWLEFKDHQYLRDITADTQAKSKSNPGGLLRHRIRAGDTITRVEPQKPRHEPEIKIYTRCENSRWWLSLSEEEKLEVYDFASWKFPPLLKHIDYAKVSYFDDSIVGHWMFGLLMDVVGRSERAPCLSSQSDGPRLEPACLSR